MNLETASTPPLEPSIAHELAAVESHLTQALCDRSCLLTQMMSQATASGGKRLRPTACLLAGLFGHPARRERVIRVAAGLEMIHMATLIHDDVVDLAETRRGRPTLSAQWGNGLAVLGGDWLFASSFELLYNDDDPELMRMVVRMVRELCAGTIEEAEIAGTFCEDLQQYYERIYRKTAIFFETACRAGARAGAASAETQRTLGTYGRRMGLAFQIVDDILDFTGKPERTGKPSGGDLRNGITTLPMILGYRFPAARLALTRCFGRRDIDQSEVGQVTEALHKAGALSEATRIAQDLAAQARRTLLPLTNTGPVESMATLADLAIIRDR